MHADALLTRIVERVYENIPKGNALLRARWRVFTDRNHSVLLEIVREALAAKQTRTAAPAGAEGLPADEWTAGERTRANVDALTLLAALPPGATITDDQRRRLLRYSGWGGLSIERALPKLPEGLVPESRGLVHEFYTPSRVAAEIARIVRPLLPGLPRHDGRILALEPSAGIGRLIHPLTGPGASDIQWTAVEWSRLSARLLALVQPGITVYEGPFERWVAEHGPAFAGRLGLVVSNPPYGKRGASVTEDPDRAYRDGRAYIYFMRRALDLLARDGVGIFLVPYGVLSGKTPEMHRARERLLARHHLACAWRLPSVLFPGANLVVDLHVWRSRGGIADHLPPGDLPVLDGDYFKQYPTHILGREIDRTAAQGKRARRGYEIEGTFDRLPDLVERSQCACAVRAPGDPKARPPAVKRTAVRRDEAVEGLPEPLDSAVALGRRVDRYLAAVAQDDPEAPRLLWRDLRDALLAWHATHGNPWSHTALRQLAGRMSAAARFLESWTKDARLIDGLDRAPAQRDPRPDPGQPGPVARTIWNRDEALTVAGLAEAYRRFGIAVAPEALRDRLLDTGAWCIDRGADDQWDQLVPADVYYTGNLWPRLDRAATATDNPRVAAQHERLRGLIGAVPLEDIEGVNPRSSWLPIDIVAAWVSSAIQPGWDHGVPLVYRDGVLTVDGVDYDELPTSEEARERWAVRRANADLPPVDHKLILFLGWYNHDLTLWRPPRQNKEEKEDEARERWATLFVTSFRDWLISQDVPVRQRVLDAYMRQYRGWVQPTYPEEPVSIPRWDGRYRLHAYQNAAVRRCVANRGGLVALDVGLGKTWVGLATVAIARQEGWSRRPVICVPNSLVWKWKRDAERLLPDFRVVVIGSEQIGSTRGRRAGQIVARPDNPAERGRKWTRFQAGEFDLALLTYTALPRTQLNEQEVLRFVESHAALKREITLRRRNASRGGGKLTEREQAILREGSAAWVAEVLETPKGWQYDRGPTWDDIGVDLLIVDEAQNFKNLHMPEQREGGVPKFLGHGGDGSKRAWQLAFRAAAVRRRAGGKGIVLLSATPAKNSPLEFYNLLSYLDENVWTRHGIRDPEQFLDRFVAFEPRLVLDVKMQPRMGAAAVGFQNLHEFRDILLRHAEFRSAVQVGLKEPAVETRMVRVPMDAYQERQYADGIAIIESHAKRMRDRKSAMIVLGQLARLSMVAIHGHLPHHDWHTARKCETPGSPKLDACADAILQRRDCSHIVFADNTAVHVWMREVLVQRGFPRERIAILNAEAVPDLDERIQIAQAFNGDPDLGIDARFDVIICNAVAYEGIDLQRRTCAIHHLDLPWEPATLLQRNGRGVRQGNMQPLVAIYYYVADRSTDSMRFSLIDGKRGWMVSLLESQDRETNNPSAQTDLSPEQVLAQISRNPEQVKALIAEMKARIESEEAARKQRMAAKLLRAADAYFRQAERMEHARDTAGAMRARTEGEERMKALAKVDRAAWPWIDLAQAVRRQPCIVGPTGEPFFEGARWIVGNTYGNRKTMEFGRVRDGKIGARAAGSAAWEGMGPDNLRPTEGDRQVPASDGDFIEDPARVFATTAFNVNLHAGAIRWAPDAWLARYWTAQGARYIEQQAARHPGRSLPAVVDGALALVPAREAGPHVILAPTAEGWGEFTRLANASPIERKLLADVAESWWARRLPARVKEGEKERAA